MAVTNMLGTSWYITFAVFFALLALGGGTSVEAAPAIDLTAFDGRTIDSLVVENRNIYDTEQDRHDRWVFRLANSLHWKTIARVVKRELLFGQGEPFDAELCQETARNLRGRLALYDAWIEPVVLPDGRLLVRVVTIDEWSLSGGLTISHVANQTNWRIGPEERNLFGRNLFLAMTYSHDAEEGDFVSTSFADKRVFGRKVRVDAEYSGDPRNEVRGVWVSRPIYDLAQRWQYELQVVDAVGRRDLYRDQFRIAESDYTLDKCGLMVGRIVGDKRERATIQLAYTYLNRGVPETRILSDQPDDSLAAKSSFPQDSLYHLGQLAVQFDWQDYVTLRQIDGFGYTEDYAVGTSVQGMVGRAFDHGRTEYDRCSLGASYTNYFRRTLVTMAADGMVWISDGHQYRRVLRTVAKVHSQGLGFLTIAWDCRFTQDWAASGANRLILGGGLSGIRGLSREFRSGNRKAVAHLEGRMFTGVSILTANIGLAVFADAGRTWKAGESLAVRDFYGSAGMGLRIGFENASKSALLRIDVAYSDSEGWQISAGSGQFFSATAGLLSLTSH